MTAGCSQHEVLETGLQAGRGMGDRYFSGNRRSARVLDLLVSDPNAEASHHSQSRHTSLVRPALSLHARRTQQAIALFAYRLHRDVRRCMHIYK